MKDYFAQEMKRKAKGINVAELAAKRATQAEGFAHELYTLRHRIKATMQTKNNTEIRCIDDVLEILLNLEGAMEQISQELAEDYKTNFKMTQGE